VLKKCLILGFNDKIQVMDMGKLNTSQGRNLTIVDDRRWFSIGWERWDDGGGSLCNVTSNGTTVGNTTVCVSSCSHTSLVLYNMTQQTDSLYGVGHRLNDEEDGELWRVSVS
ncbi:LOW QUALITY PROTEIN: protein RL5A, partial [Human betaherpesvirus 5]